MPYHTPHSVPSVIRILIALSVLVTLAVAAPVAADEPRYPDAIMRGDPFLGGNVQAEGSSAPKNAGADPMPFAGTINGACDVGVTANGTLAYQRTVYTATLMGYTGDTHFYADPGCTVPLFP